MRKLILLSGVLFASVASAQSCAPTLMPAFTAQQAREICSGIVSPTITTPTLSGAVTANSTISTTGLRFPVANYAVVAGAGTTEANAAILTAGSNIFRLTGANGTVGWKFPTSVAGEFKILLNTTAGVAKIYAATGGTVNGGAVNASFDALTGIKPILCFSTAVDTWICS